MKKLLIPVMLLAIGYAFFEQSRSHPNLYITIIAIVIFMLAMMRLSARIPSKNRKNESDDIE